MFHAGAVLPWSVLVDQLLTGPVEGGDFVPPADLCEPVEPPVRDGLIALTPLEGSADDIFVGLGDRPGNAGCFQLAEPFVARPPPVDAGDIAPAFRGPIVV